MADLFDPIESPSGPQSAQEFSTRVDAELNNAVARDNLLADDAAMDRRVLAGSGRLESEGAEVSVVGGAVRISNGFFYAGPGVDEEDDAFFEGLRLKQIASEYGYLELTGADEPPLNKSSGTFGYMSWYGDTIWFNSRQSSDEQIAALFGRWCLGKVVTDGAGAVSVDTSYTDSIPNLSAMAGLIAALTTRVETLESLGGGEGGGSAYSGINPWLPAPLDSRQTSVVLLEKFAAMQAQIDALSGSNTRPFQTRNDQMMSRIALLEQGVTRTHRDEGRRYESAHVLLADDDVVYGTGSSGDENFVGEGVQPNDEGKFEI